jgi:hypothetical protein
VILFLAGVIVRVGKLRTLQTNDERKEAAERKEDHGISLIFFSPIFFSSF